MKYEKETTSTFPQPEDARALSNMTSNSDSAHSGDVTLAPHLRSHLGRTLRRYYEPEVGQDLPEELQRLMKKLETVDSPGERGDR
ncbi:hypothetical protein [Amorphus orientalis]|uniref:Anti-sigma factor NepR domain-containing protein n=1 Tax=Amorphus orientalis TaxID=649198 RepID=A0AAE4ASK2_9HYPH|nr:hypothetical protein [Amorphus orientalis]MDQ0316361.1 hypothetical protein [Amorphus orientalis]